MQTSLECLHCFINQAHATARLSSDEPKVLRQVISEVGQLVSRLDLSLSPPENAVDVYGLIAKITGDADPYEQLKKNSNDMALGMRNRIRIKIEEAENPLMAALRFAVATNIIDYGAGHDFDVMTTLTNCLEEDIHIDDTDGFIRDITSASGLRILYLADNSGEIVFDGLLIEQLLKQGCNVTYAVRETPILNDVTMKEAAECGIDKMCHVISNGTGCPGTPLGSCSPEFKKVFAGSDMIISKGQGNFETLSDIDAPIYFLLTVKCPVVRKHISAMRKSDVGCISGDGEMIVMKRSS